MDLILTAQQLYITRKTHLQVSKDYVFAVTRHQNETHGDPLEVGLMPGAQCRAPSAQCRVPRVFDLAACSCSSLDVFPCCRMPRIDGRVEGGKLRGESTAIQGATSMGSEMGVERLQHPQNRQNRRKEVEPGLSIHLVGVVHLDPHGPKRLARLLDDLAPETVTVEVSPYAVAFRQEEGPKLLERLEPFRRSDGSLPGRLPGVEAQLRVPFEAQVASEAHRAHGAGEVHLIGDSELSRGYLELFCDETMTQENLQRLSMLPDMVLGEEVAREWIRAHRGWHLPVLLGTEEAHAWRVREEALAQRIVHHGLGGVKGGEEGRRLLHIGGWRHLSGLAELLKRPVGREGEEARSCEACRPREVCPFLLRNPE